MFLRLLVRSIVVSSLLLSLNAITVPSAPVNAAPSSEALPSEYLVMLQDNIGDVEKVAKAIARQYQIKVTDVFDMVGGFAAMIPHERLLSVTQDSRVLFIEQDRVIYGDGQLGTATDSMLNTVVKEPLMQAALLASTGLRRIGGSTDGQRQTVSLPYTSTGGAYQPNHGTAIGVAVLDTGIDPTHPDLPAVLGEKNCIGGKTTADDHGHGTAVAGIITARDDGVGVIGVAPGVNLYSVKVLDSANRGTFKKLTCGVNWVIKNAKLNNIQVVNISAGGIGTATPSNAKCQNSTGDMFHIAICKAVKAGITVVVAAGNDKIDAANVLPADYEEVITVSAIADADGKPGGVGGAFGCPSSAGVGIPSSLDDTFLWGATKGSNFGAVVDIAAPGMCIQTTANGGGYLDVTLTSFATPHVSGAAALYKKAHPNATPAQVKAGLLANWEPGPISGDPDSSPEGVVYVGTPLVYVANKTEFSGTGVCNTPGSVSVIDPASNTIVNRITVEYCPSHVAASPDGKQVYVTNSYHAPFPSTIVASVSVIDTATSAIVGTVLLGDGGGRPVGIGISPDSKKIYVPSEICDKGPLGPNAACVAVIDADSLGVTYVPIEAEFPQSAAVAPDGTAFVPAQPDCATECFRSKVFIIPGGGVLSEVPCTVEGTQSPAIDPGGKYLYVANRQSCAQIGGQPPLSGGNTVTVIPLLGGAGGGEISAGDSPYSLVVNPKGTFLYVANYHPTNTVTVVGTGSNTVVDVIALGGPSGNGIAITPNSAQVYVSSPTGNLFQSYHTISAINFTTQQVTTINGEDSPWGVAVKP